MNAKIMLCCHGLKEFGLTMCEGCTNAIVDLNDIPDQDERIYSYLDHHCKLFDVVNTDNNKISSIVNFLCTNHYIPSHQEEAIFKFVRLHKPCGLFMYVRALGD